MQQLNSLIIIAAILANVLLLVGFGLLMPRWLRRQDHQAADEATRLREMLLDVLSEQEAVTLRQVQIGSSLSSLQDQIGRLGEIEPARLNLSAANLAEAAGIPRLERQIEALRQQVGTRFERDADEARVRQSEDRARRLEESQSWSNLLGLLATMQDNIASLNDAVGRQPQADTAADRLLLELDAEMQNLRTLADEIAGVQWKLRRSVLERETSLAALRAQVRNATPRRFGHRAA